MQRKKDADERAEKQARSAITKIQTTIKNKHEVRIIIHTQKLTYDENTGNVIGLFPSKDNLLLYLIYTYDAKRMVVLLLTATIYSSDL